MEALFIRAAFQSSYGSTSFEIFVRAKSGEPCTAKMVFKLLGYDFLVEYKSENTNQVVDAVSWLPLTTKAETLNQLSTLET